MAARSKSKAKATPPSEVLLEWSLAQMPSSQHRAGLAGLVLMVRWLERQPRARPGICRLERVTANGCALRLDERGLQELFDQVYGATQAESESSKLRTKKNQEVVEPIRTEERPQFDKVGQPTGKTKTVYIYPQVVPSGAFLTELDPTRSGNEGAWVKLWRDMVWSVLRGIPAQRNPYNQRAEGLPTTDAATAWEAVLDESNPTVDLPSTYFVGAQQYTAELVPFCDRARFQFLLHFAPFTLQVYVPAVVDSDGKRDFAGFALAIPDVCDLERFCEEFVEIMRARGVERTGYRPREAVVDLAVEGGLDFLSRLAQRLRVLGGDSALAASVLGVDVVHLEKDGNNVRLRGSTRVEAEWNQVDAYARIRSGYWDPVFRRQRLLNLVAGRPWYTAFDRLISTLPASRTIESQYFRRDAREALTQETGEPHHE
jgi:CRISPR-associated protein Cmx8